ncbi:hypothetical protein Sjap_024901 [Stephania japonica]|uniref:Uncharacterized protein n=1 Tax=Stephania japonica TaxID=461633 RepID=A0AAP0HLY6_9MAGN
MQSTGLLIPSLCPSSRPSLPAMKSGGRNIGIRRGVRVLAKAYDWDYGGRLVDESMIVLRKRIREMKMVERNYKPPKDWMEWEKQCYTSYDSNVCYAMGLLQTQLMNMRPSLALGMAALVALSVPTSTFFILFHLIGVTNGIFSGIN